MTLPEQIGRTRAQIAATKPRASRRVELECRLRELVFQQLKREIRDNRKANK